MKLEHEPLGVQMAVAATPMHVEFSSPGGAEAVARSGENVVKQRKRRLTEAQRLMPFSWDAAAVGPGPAMMRQFLAAEVSSLLFLSACASVCHLSIFARATPPAWHIS